MASRTSAKRPSTMWSQNAHYVYVNVCFDRTLSDLCVIKCMPHAADVRGYRVPPGAAEEGGADDDNAGEDSDSISEGSTVAWDGSLKLYGKILPGESWWGPSLTGVRMVLKKDVPKCGANGKHVKCWWPRLHASPDKHPWVAVDWSSFVDEDEAYPFGRGAPCPYCDPVASRERLSVPDNLPSAPPPAAAPKERAASRKHKKQLLAKSPSAGSWRRSHKSGAP